MALISQADLEARLGRGLTASESTSFATINTANQSYIERVILGTKVESVSATSRFYDGGLQHTSIDPCTSVSGVFIVDDDQVVSDTLDTTDYTLEPINQTLKTMLRWRSGPLPRGINNLKITAKFSIYEDTDVLNVVKDAMLESLEAEINDTSNIKSEKIASYSIEYATTETKNAMRKIRGLFPNII